MTDIQAQWATTCERCGSSKFSADGMLSYSCPVCIPIDPASLPSPAPDSPLEALSWLGNTVEEVAEGLRARGIKGHKYMSTSCPLAVYLSEWWDDVSVGVECIHRDGAMLPEPLPRNVRAFRHIFDSGQFPDLIDNG